MPDTLDEDIARPARLASVAKIAVSVAYLAALALYGDEYPQLLAGLIFVPVCVLTAIRHVRVLTIQPFIVLTPRYLAVCWWETVFLVPWVFRKEERIAWKDLDHVEVNTLKVNGYAVTALRLHHRGEELTIEPGVFAENARELAQRIAAYPHRGGSRETSS